MSIIKISALNKKTIVNESQRHKLNGITANPVHTYRTVVIPVDISGQIFIVKFDVVPTDFRIPESGILGRDFLKTHTIILDMSQDMFVMPSAAVKPVILPPRSNCVLAVVADEPIDHEIVTIKKQELSENVILANCKSRVINNQIMSTIINISEEPFTIENFGTSNLKWKPYNEQVLAIKSNINGDGQRIDKFTDLITTEHLNNRSL